MKNIYIVILPDLNTKNYLESLRSKLVTKYDLILPKHPLHITLRSTFKVKNYNFLIKDLEVYLKGKQSFYLTTKKISFFAGNTVVAEIRNKKIVKDLAKDIVKIAQKYKVNEEIKQKKPRSLKKSKYLEVYGDQFIFEYYKPHITLLYNKNKEKFNIDLTRKKILCDSVAVVEKIKTDKGFNHKIIKIIKFKL